MTAMSIIDLPIDILVLVLPYLDAKSFLAFCATCKAFQQNSIRLDPAYWRHATQTTFRVPNQPVVEHDGVRWSKLFRRLLTQSRVYTWGSNDNGRLGHATPELDNHIIRRPRVGHMAFNRFGSACSQPIEMERSHDLGIIADMQCGGWSTTLLTSKGTLYTAGILNGISQYVRRGERSLKALRFPAGFPYTTELAAYEEPTIAIRQFSSGRSHVLGLSDSGRIWSWYDTSKPALHVKFFDVDITEASSGQFSSADHPLYGRVQKIVAGWSCSSAYIYGTGIVLWDPVQREAHENDETDTMLVMKSVVVPKTAYQRSKSNPCRTDEDKAVGDEVGVVLNYIVLEHYIVFVTDLGRVFCGKLGDENVVEEILELRALRNAQGATLDVQGSFRSFAIFRNEEVITTHQSYLDACWNVRQSDLEQAEVEGLRKIPVLQKNGVISVAFGDYHFHALHSTGKITSYGKELQSCGSLGLGRGGRLRSVHMGADGELRTEAYTYGRQIWFEPFKHEWIRHIAEGGRDVDESKERLELWKRDLDVQREVSEWVEQETRHMDTLVPANVEDDGLGAYFALNVCAAGWHSGAVVLVNEALAEAQAQHQWTKQDFPRLHLSDGRDMPGTVDFHEWRNEVREWQLGFEV